MKTFELDPRHWTEEDFRQKVTKEEVQDMVLNDKITVNFKGTPRKLSWGALGAGVYEVYKLPLGL